MFAPTHISLAGGFHASGPVDQVFELFSPLGEKSWVPGWAPELLHPPGVAWARGLIFRTREETGDAIWVVTRLDAATHEVEYHRVEPDRYVVRVAVHCTPVDGRRTEVATVYEFTGLSDSGNAEIAAMSKAAYAEKMARWSRWINGHLAGLRP